MPKSRPQAPAKAATRSAAKAALDGAAKSMRRKVRAVAQFVPIPQQIDRALRVLDTSCVFLTRAELETLAREVAADYCGAEGAPIR